MEFWVIALISALAAILIVKFLPTPEKNIRGKKVLITGGASGIGKLMAIEFAKLNCKIVIWDVNQKLLDEATAELKQKHKADITPFQIDITDRQAVAALADRIKKDMGMMDIVINNAGVVAGDFVWNLRDEQIERVMKVNALAPMWVTRAFLPEMISSNSGHLVFIVSAAATTATPKLSDYVASKFAAFGFAEGVRLDIHKKGYNIDTTIVCPFYINTGMFDGVKSTNPLFPILQPDYVVERIMHGIKTRQKEIYLPAIVGIAYLLRFLLPAGVRDWAQDILGISKSMDEFHGQRKVE